MNKTIVFVIQYKVDPEFTNMYEILQKLSEYGEARIIDVSVEDKE